MPLFVISRLASQVFRRLSWVDVGALFLSIISRALGERLVITGRCSLIFSAKLEVLHAPRLGLVALGGLRWPVSLASISRLSLMGPSRISGYQRPSTPHSWGTWPPP